MAGKLTRVPGTKGVARYNHTDMAMHTSAKSLTDGGSGAKGAAAAGISTLSFTKMRPMKPSSAPGL